MTEKISRRTACELLDVGHTRLATMLRDGMLAGLTLEDVLEAREQRWVTIGEAALILGVSRSMVGQLADAGRLPYHQPRPGARRWFRTGPLAR